MTNYKDKYKKYLDKAFDSYGITHVDINLPPFDTKKQYNKDDFQLLYDQIKGWEFYHPLRATPSFQLDVEYKRLRDSGELKDELPRILLKDYQTRKRFRLQKQEAPYYPDMTAHEMVIKNYRDEIKRRADLKAKGLRPTVSIPGGKRKTKRRRKKKRKSRKKRRRRTRKKRRSRR